MMKLGDLEVKRFQARGSYTLRIDSLKLRPRRVSFIHTAELPCGFTHCLRLKVLLRVRTGTS